MPEKQPLPKVIITTIKNSLRIPNKGGLHPLRQCKLFEIVCPKFIEDFGKPIDKQKILNKAKKKMAENYRMCDLNKLLKRIHKKLTNKDNELSIVNKVALVQVDNQFRIVFWASQGFLEDFGVTCERRGKIKKIDKYINENREIPLELLLPDHKEPEPQRGIHQELEKFRLDPHDKENERIKEVFVKPRNKYKKAKNRLLKHGLVIISGPPHIGKTSMALYLAMDVCEKKFVNDIFKLRHFDKEIDEKLLLLYKQDTYNCIIIDDVFGSRYKPNFDVGNKFDQLQKFTDKGNLIILTTDRQLLKEAICNTKFGEMKEEYIYSHFVVELEQEQVKKDFPYKSLMEILKRHLTYELKAGNITKEQEKIAIDHRKEICSRLKFPNNYKQFVKVHLKEVTMKNKGISLRQEVERACNIEEAVKKWFLNLNESEQYYVICVFFFESTGKDKVNDCYSKVIDRMREFNPNLLKMRASHVRKHMDIYITEEPWFRNTSYWLGVAKGLKGFFGEKEDDPLVSIIQELSSQLYEPIQYPELESLNPKKFIEFINQKSPYFHVF